MKVLLVNILSLLIFAYSLQGQTVRSYIINAEFFPKDAKMYSYPVSPNSFMRANSLIEFSEMGKESLTFYLHGELKVDSIMQEQRKVEYKSEKVFYNYNYSLIALKVTVNTSEIGAANKFDVFYSGFFNPSRASSLSDYMRIDNNEGVFLRAYGYSLWFPVFAEPGEDSYKADFKSITVKIPDSYKVVIVGEKISESVENDLLTSVWHPGITDISDVQCTAREFEEKSRDNISVYYVSSGNNSQQILDFTNKMKNFYASHYKQIDSSIPIHIIEMPKYGDISSGNVVGISTKVYSNFVHENYSKITIAHELVHPYVQIPVSKSNPFSAFVVEGFPSFFHLYALARLDESFNFSEYMIRVEKRYLKKKQRTDFIQEKAILEIKFDEIRIYKDRFVLNDRVLLFFYNLWNKMGDNNFDKFLKELFTFDSIDYQSFENLIVEFLPEYKEKLNTWLNTTDYTEDIQIQ